jgi:hypothetical protein
LLNFAQTHDVNEFIQEASGSDKTSHFFRHAMKDCLRNAEVSEELAKNLMGHGTRSVADGYGEGFSLQRLQAALVKVTISPEKCHA